ncbi:MAG: hypothetical protein MK096_15030 [Oleiphilaceae bacterium]|nr:hypothetical protein [Oleiphilaceae bacterium]
MIQTKSIVLPVLGLFMAYSSFVSAEDSPRWVQGAKIENVSVQPNGNMYMTVSVDVPDLGCNYSGNRVLQFDTDAPNFKEQYSLVLASFMAGKSLDVYVSGCGSAYPYAQNTNVHNG